MSSHIVTAASKVTLVSRAMCPICEKESVIATNDCKITSKSVCDHFTAITISDNSQCMHFKSHQAEVGVVRAVSRYARQHPKSDEDFIVATHLAYSVSDDDRKGDQSAMIAISAAESRLIGMYAKDAKISIAGRMQ